MQQAVLERRTGDFDILGQLEAQFESALYYNWNRQYDPSIARYTQPDPLGDRLITPQPYAD